MNAPDGPIPDLQALPRLQSAPDFGLLDVVATLSSRWKLLVVLPVVVALAALAGSYLVRPTFTARSTILPPTPSGSSASLAIAQLGALAGLAGGGGPLRTPADQFVALMYSERTLDHLVERFKLVDVYEARLKTFAKLQLQENLRINANKKDGLIVIEVDDHDPTRAAEMANEIVGQLRALSNELALTEAQQRRLFFETQLEQARTQLTKAQQALESSGFGPGAIRAEPRAATERYARLQAELTSAEVRLQALRRTFTDDAPEVQQQVGLVSALRTQLGRTEAVPDNGTRGGEYISRYREFKYRETLFDLFARQYEMARVDESREGALIQVVDRAVPPEVKSAPRRGLVAAAAYFAALLALVFGLVAHRALVLARTRTQP